MAESSSQGPSVLDLDLRLQHKNFVLQIDEVLPTNGVTAIFGRSGSGKTTLLRCIAGFERGEGSIEFANSSWLNSDRGVFVPAHKRGIGYMFQDARLFPHLSVADNLNYAVQRAKMMPHVVALSEVVEAFALGDLLQRAPAKLSGGEAQRVALARTLLTQPRLLLLDEPLAALDDTHKAEMLPYLETLVREFAVPMLYVSHDVEEVARLASNMLVLANGRVEALGSTAEVFERLDVQAVGGRFDAGALLTAEIVAHDERWQLTQLSLAGQSIRVPLRAPLQPGDNVQLRIKARDVALATQRPVGLSIRNVLAGTVQALAAEHSSPYAEVVVELTSADAVMQPVRLRSRITRAAVDDLNLGVGSSVFALVKSVTFDS